MVASDTRPRRLSQQREIFSLPCIPVRNKLSQKSSAVKAQAVGVTHLDVKFGNGRIFMDLTFGDANPPDFCSHTTAAASEIRRCIVRGDHIKSLVNVGKHGFARRTVILLVELPNYANNRKITASAFSYGVTNNVIC